MESELVSRAELQIGNMWKICIGEEVESVPIIRFYFAYSLCLQFLCVIEERLA
jgi:hypothetical protein